MFGFLGGDDDDEGEAVETPEASMRIVPSASRELSKSAADDKADDKALQPAPVDVGEDLRRVRKEERRALDLEDPFQ